MADRMSLYLPGDDDDIPENVTARDVLRELRKLERRLAPALDFYQRASAVLGVIKWAGPTTLLFFIGGALWLVRPPG